VDVCVCVGGGGCVSKQVLGHRARVPKGVGVGCVRDVLSVIECVCVCRCSGMTLSHHIGVRMDLCAQIPKSSL